MKVKKKNSTKTTFHIGFFLDNVRYIRQLFIKYTTQKQIGKGDKPSELST